MLASVPGSGCDSALIFQSAITCSGGRNSYSTFSPSWPCRIRLWSRIAKMIGFMSHPSLGARAHALRPEKPRSGYDVGAMSAQIAPELIERLIRTCPLGALQGGTRQNRDVTSDHDRENRREHQDAGKRGHHELADYCQPERGLHLDPPRSKASAIGTIPKVMARAVIRIGRSRSLAPIFAGAHGVDFPLLG
jgi:hypothetical protein